MKKKQFRIVTIHKGFITLYKSQVKTWLGWIRFSADEWGDIYYSEMISTTPYKRHVYENIDYYCKIKGLTKDQIEVIEMEK